MRLQGSYFGILMSPIGGTTYYDYYVKVFLDLE